jgi:hypothetical protein
LSAEARLRAKADAGRGDFKRFSRTNGRCKKIATISFMEISRFREGEPHMRIANLLFVGSIAAVLAAPVLAKNSDAQKMEEDKSASPPCHASVPAANGSGTQLPCEEVGAETQSPHKPSARSAEAGH